MAEVEGIGAGVEDESGLFALLVFTLVRGTAVDASVEDAVQADRAGLRSAIRSGSTDLVAYDVVAGIDERWVGGGIDVVLFATLHDLAGGAASVAAIRGAVPTDPSVSFRAFAAVRNVVRPTPADGMHTFSSGGMADGFDRMTWQARWRRHAELLDTTPAFSPFLAGYVQHHGLDTPTAARLGLDDTHGIAHMTYRSVEEQAAALALPEYQDVLRPDEDQFISRRRGMRVRVSRADPA
jgi:hypothetical protein